MRNLSVIRSQHSLRVCYSPDPMVDVIRRRRAAVGVLLATIAVSLLGVLPNPASADQISDKQAQANSIAAKIDQLNQQIEQAANAAEAAQVQLDQLNQQIADAQQKVAEAQAQEASDLDQLKSYAVNAYVTGSDTTSKMAVSTASANDQGQIQGYLAAAAGNRQNLIDHLRATQEDVKSQISQLNDAQAQAATKTKQLQDQKSSAQSAVQQQQALYNQTQGEIADLVKQAQAKAAAEAQAAAEARAKAAAQAQQAPADVRSKSSGGGSSSSSGSAPSAPTGPAPSPNGGAGAAIAYAQRQLGKPYEWGAAGPDSFDCSGLTMMAWRAGGVNLDHYTGSQYSETTHIPISALQPGDLVFFNGMEHVGLYVGNGQMIHAPHTGSVVQYESIYYWNTSMVASRP